MKRLLVGLLFSLLVQAAHAQGSFITPNGAYVLGIVPMCDNGSSQKVVCTTANPVPVTLPPNPLTVTWPSALPVTVPNPLPVTWSSGLPVTVPNPLPVQVAAYSYNNITASTTTTVKSGAGVLHTVNVNALGSVASTVAIFDNTAGSGTSIATVNSLAFLGTLTFDVAFTTGLTIVTTGVLPPNVTVSYR